MTPASTTSGTTPVLNLEGRTFQVVSNASGEVDDDTLFHYHQQGTRVWATYAGGAIQFGTLIAIMAADGSLDMRYQHTDLAGAFRTGECRSTPEVLSDGRVRYHESWRWTSGKEGVGTSIIEEVIRNPCSPVGTSPSPECGSAAVGTPLTPRATPSAPGDATPHHTEGPGERLDGPPPPIPSRASLRGPSITLDPVDPARDAPQLFAAIQRGADSELWTWMSCGPFADADALGAWLAPCAASADPLYFTIRRGTDRQAVGVSSFLNIIPAMRRLELGNIWLAPEAQRTPILTEMAHLMMVEAFDHLGYRRVEWKCNALNRRSRAAARRLGFSFEGVFRNHMVVKGRSRDTAWYAITDVDWPALRANLERWLAAPDRSSSLRAVNRPLLRPGPVDDVTP